ncbi:DNA polymerase I [candidate division KSB1 bacterium]
MPERFFIVDGTALVYRSFFAFIRNPLINSRGENTSAAFGFASSVLRLIRDERPEYLAVTFDSKEPTFRHEMYGEYKATREKMPDDLVGQLSRIDELVDTLNIASIALPGYEADDIMGTLARRGYDSGLDVYLVTGDKDLMQLVNDRVYWMNLRKSTEQPELLNPGGVKDKFGVPPGQVIDVLALMGDTSDNVPGVAGVGPKTAVRLIEEYGNMENVLQNISQIKQKGLREKLEHDRESAFLSKKLVTIDCDVPLDFSLEGYKFREPDARKARTLFQELEFTSLVDQLPRTEYIQEEQRIYSVVLTERELEELAGNLRGNRFAFDLETTGLDLLTADIVGFSFSFSEKTGYYIPVTAPDTEIQLSYEQIVSVLKPLLEDAGIQKCAQNAKFDMSILQAHGVQVKGIVFDTMIAAYLLEPDKRQYGIDRLSSDYLNTSKIPTSDLIGSGSSQISMSEVPLDKIAEYACEDADHAYRLWQLFEPMLADRGLDRLNSEIEIPLIGVLMGMELTGVSLDTAFLEKMSEKLHAHMELLKGEIYQLAGEEFNISSPQQLGRILFEKMEIQKDSGVKRVRKTKLGYSTDISVLEQFQSSEIVSRILEYRQYTKLLSTYVDALPRMIHPKTGRVHSSFNQTIAATGRLSSTKPNLQNIPIRTALGREIRRAFVPMDDSWSILSADYSQIELRIMAHLSGDEAMRDAFNEGRDIHTMTAAKIFGVNEAEVEPEMRYRAKSINFGIMYGMSPYRLAREIGISNEKAQNFIFAYFQTFPGIDNYIADQLAKARELGYVSTMMGRRRYLPELHSDNQRIRQSAENVAINTPLQGTAAELIKVAMINLSDKLKSARMEARLVLQIHDELVLEVPGGELERCTLLVRESMENTLELTVPLVVDIHTGKNWFEAH